MSEIIGKAYLEITTLLETARQRESALLMAAHWRSWHFSAWPYLRVLDGYERRMERDAFGPMPHCVTTWQLADADCQSQLIGRWCGNDVFYVMHWLQGWLVFSLLLLSSTSVGKEYDVWQNLEQPTRSNWDCVAPSVDANEIVSDQQFSTSDHFERVVVYLDDDIHLLVASQDTSGACSITLDTHLESRTLLTGQQVVVVRTIEMVELTGDTTPELHLWIEKRGGGGGATR